MMERVSEIIPEITMPFKALFVFTLVLTLIWALQGITYYSIQDNTPVWQGTCSFQEWDDSGDLGLVVDCGEHGEGNISTDSLLRSYLNNPGPLTCELSAADNISCEDRPSLDPEND